MKKRPFRNTCDTHLKKYITFLNTLRKKKLISQKTYQYWLDKVIEELEIRKLI